MKQNFSLLPSETLWLMHFLPEMELPKYLFGASQVALVVKNLPANAADARDAGSIPGSGRSHGEGSGSPHSSILAWEIPWTEEPGGLQSMRS